MKGDKMQKFLAKIAEIAEEDEIPCLVWYEEDYPEVIKGIMLGEQEFIDVWFDDIDIDKSKKIH